MAQIATTVIDAADIRAYECLLPDSEPISVIAARLAEMMHFPSMGPDGRPMRYGLIPKGGALLDPDATLSELNLPSPLTVRLVPEISAGAGEGVSGEEAGVGGPQPPGNWEPTPPGEIIISEPVALVHDTELDSRPDVRIDAEVHKKIEAFALANRNQECAGLLLGSIDSEGRGRIIHITAAVPAESAVGTKASVRIPLHAWEEMLRVRDLDFGGLRILGWFHSHAGWGVFMSDADVFIHRHFFPHPNMVAYVLDPTSARDGFFYWHDGKIGLCPSYGLVGTPRDLKSHHRPRAKASRTERAEPKAKPAQEPQGSAAVWPALSRWLGLKNAAIGALVLGVLYFAFAGSLFARHNAGKPAKSSKSAAAGSRGMAETRELPSGRTGTRLYAIQKRDNPWAICNRVYDDGELGPYLMRYNHMKPNPCLQVGQQIKLPPKETLRKMAGH